MSRPKITDADRDREVRLEAGTFSKLEKLADSWDMSIPEALRQLIAAACDLEQQDAQFQALSPKQKEVLKCLKAGLSVKEIADQLGVKEETIRTHIHRIRGILDCSDLLALRFNGVSGDLSDHRDHPSRKLPL
jgi:RNA polymerase sigma factor (sigma-70 family)